MAKPTFYEFFAGGGMARAGLGDGWQCLFANDFDHKKSESYRRNWGGDELLTGDVRNITTAHLPDRADLIWASFPCQDLSLAGGGAGLKGERSGTFWPFWDVVKSLREENRHPPLLVLENVCGALTSHGGKAFEAICNALAEQGYLFGALVMDAALFVPQSRPRLFIIGVHNDVAISISLSREMAAAPWHSKALRTAFERLPAKLQDAWIWWRLPAPSLRNLTFADLIEDEPTGVCWHSREETRSLLAKMCKVNLAKLEAARKSGRKVVGTLYKRTRYNAAGERVQRAEARFDDVAGCLRTPAGGSSRQTILMVESGGIRSRLISARETARLMGLPDDYILPPNYNEAYHLTGDGVVVPVVRHLAEYLLEPVLACSHSISRAAA